jgi:methionyl-tRNA formyltransferase
VRGPAPGHPRRLAYLGTPDVAVTPLRALVAAGYEVPLVISAADKKRGRGGRLVPSPVKAAALDLGLPVTSTVDDVLGAGADAAVVVAFGRIIRPHVLDAVPMLNMHFSLLPRWRGAAPVERAILAGEPETGVCIMVVDDALDEGAVYGRRVVPIGPDASADDLRQELVDDGTSLLLELLAEGLPDPEPQVGEATYAAKIDPAELLIDWTKPALEVHRLVRVGGAWTPWRGTRFKLWATAVAPAATGDPLAPGEIDPDRAVVGTGDGNLSLRLVQPEGKSRQAADAWRHGAHLHAGDRFGDDLQEHDLIAEDGDG